MQSDVLAYENNLINSRLLTMFLNQLGYSVNIEATVSGFVEKLKKSTYKLVFIDVSSPSLSYETLKDIVYLAKSKNPTPCLLAILNPGTNEGESYIDLGMDNFITRPVSSKIIKEAVAKGNCGNKKTESSEHVSENSIDLEKVGKILGLTDIQLLKGIFTQFFESTNKELAKLNIVSKEKNLDSIKEIAHSIKGASRNLRVNNVGSLAESIETHAKTGDDVDYASLAANLELVCKNVEESYKNKYGL